MKHVIRITPVRNEPPDLERFVAALLAFVLARREAERLATERQAARPEQEEDG